MMEAAERLPGTWLVVLVALVLCAGGPAVAAEEGLGGRFIRGDANLDARVTLADVFTILRYISLGGSLTCRSAADVDDSGSVNPTDALYLLGSIFYRHGPPPAPFAQVGPDPTPDATTCLRGLAPAGDGEEGPSPLAVEAGDDGAGAGSGCEDEEGGPDLELIHFRVTMLAAPGERFIRVPIYFRSAGGVEGLTLSVHAPPQWIRLESIDFAGSVLAALGVGPDWTHEYSLKRSEGFLSSSVALSLMPPFRTLPQLQNEIIAFLELSIHPETPIGSRLEVTFADTPAEKGLPPIHNEVSRKGQTQDRTLCGLVIEVVSPQGLFVRGDANSDRDVNLLDVVLMLRHLFVPGDGVELPCPDAADVNDDGHLQLSDPIGLASYLFLRGEAPAYPYPQAGRDSLTADDLDCERR